MPVLELLHVVPTALGQLPCRGRAPHLLHHNPHQRLYLKFMTSRSMYSPLPDLYDTDTSAALDCCLIKHPLLNPDFWLHPLLGACLVAGVPCGSKLVRQGL